VTYTSFEIKLRKRKLGLESPWSFKTAFFVSEFRRELFSSVATKVCLCLSLPDLKLRLSPARMRRTNSCITATPIHFKLEHNHAWNIQNL
jgi:hypothetical protein